MLHRFGRCLLALSATLLLAGAAHADDVFRSARVSSVRGNLSVRGVDEDDYSYIQQNAVVREGDTLWTDENGRAEVELERGSWLRMAEDTKLEFRRLSSGADVRVWTGSVYVDASDRLESPVHVETPVGDVEVDPNSVVRVDLSKEESARVSVFNGRAWVSANHGERVRVSNGRRVYLEADRDIDEAAAFNRDDRDDFDAFQRERVDYYISRPLPRHLERDIIGARDLDDYGSWVEVESATYWRPRCEPDWRPYSTGYWSYVPSCGYSWVDYSPWGYTTCHYGRWLYRPTYGWLWSPGYTWAPAYVSWSTCGSYYGWAPLDPWDRPCYYGSGTFLSIGFAIDRRCWTFCDRDRFFYGRHHPWYTGGRNVFVGGDRFNFTQNNFNVVKNVYREIGVPREHVRGVTMAKDGSFARDRVLRVENRIPERRLQLISKRFNEDGNRDRVQARRPGVVDRLQRDNSGRLDTTAHILRGDEADRRVTYRPTVTPGRAATPAVGGRDGGERVGRGDRDNGDRPGRGSRDGDRGPSANVPGERGNRNSADSGVNGGRDRGPSADSRDRDSAFRRGGNRENGGQNSGAERRGARPADRPGDRGSANRDGERGPRGGVDRAPERSPERAPDRTPTRTPDRAPSNGDRDGGFRRGGDASPGRTPDRAPSRTPDRGPTAAPDRAPSRTPDRAPDRGASPDRGNPNRGNDRDRSPSDPRRSGASSSSEGLDRASHGEAYGRRSTDRQPQYQDFPYPRGYTPNNGGDRDGGFRRGGVDSARPEAPRSDSGSIFGRTRGSDGSGGYNRGYNPAPSYGGGDRGGYRPSAPPSYGGDRGSYRPTAPSYNAPSRSSAPPSSGSYGAGSRGDSRGGSPSGGAPSGGAPSGSRGDSRGGSPSSGGYTFGRGR